MVKKPRKLKRAAPPRVHEAPRVTPTDNGPEPSASNDLATDSPPVTPPDPPPADDEAPPTDSEPETAVESAEHSEPQAEPEQEPEPSASSELVTEPEPEPSANPELVTEPQREPSASPSAESMTDPSEALLEEALAQDEGVTRPALPGVELSEELPIDPEDDLRGVEGEASPRLMSILESLLFAATRPLRVQDLRKVLPETTKHQIQLALKQLIAVTRERGILLVQVAGGFQFRTHPDNAVWVQKMLQTKPARLSRTQIETLAIVAYRQPITRPEIDDVRGVDSGAMLKALLERELIQIVGKKEEPGRPLLYGTTVRFLEFFNLRGLRDLPSLRDFRDLSEESKATLIAKLGGSEAEALGQGVLAMIHGDATKSPANDPEAPNEVATPVDHEPAADPANDAEAPSDRTDVINPTDNESDEPDATPNDHTEVSSTADTEPSEPDATTPNDHTEVSSTADTEPEPSDEPEAPPNAITPSEPDGSPSDHSEVISTTDTEPDDLDDAPSDSTDTPSDPAAEPLTTDTTQSEPDVSEPAEPAEARADPADVAAAEEPHDAAGAVHEHEPDHTTVTEGTEPDPADTDDDPTNAA